MRRLNHGAVWALAFGAISVGWLLLAVSLQLPEYHHRQEGILGTHFMDDFLFALPGDAAVIFFASLVYFVYGAVPGFVAGFLLSKGDVGRSS